jgi:hypothetical protein
LCALYAAAAMPMRDVLGQMLLELKRPDEALVEFTRGGGRAEPIRCSLWG